MSSFLEFYIWLILAKLAEIKQKKRATGRAFCKFTTDTLLVDYVDRVIRLYRLGAVIAAHVTLG